MVVEATSVRSRHRPWAVNVTICVLVFLGVTALAGGIAMVLDLGATPPGDWLALIPMIESWVVPGLVLGIGFGLGSLFTAYGMLRRPRWRWLRFVERPTHFHWSWIFTILIGLCHIAWIALELIYLPQPSILQAVYGAVGVVLLLLPLHPAVRGYLAQAQR